MRFPRRLAAAVVAAFLAASPSSADTRTVRLCADEWMPFNGVATDERPGYVIELARAIFEPRGIAVAYEVVTWEDALVAVREGRMDGAIGANRTEGAGMVIPEEPIGSPPVCLMTRADSTWTYDNMLSFRGVRLGVIKDYSYWPHLDAHIEKRAGTDVLLVGGDAPLDELMDLLHTRKVEVIAESEPVLLWHLRVHNLDRNQYRVVYKHAAEPIYVAFAPNDTGRAHAVVFDAGIREMRQSGALDTLLRRYGLRDWK